MSDNWNIDSYKTEFETEEHWELKKKFMLTHKDNIPEDELVCLAQVFTNIEFLGCRYPEQTMIRVAELAKGVVEQYREKRKNSLKRTFVAASDAASSKVKGQPAKEISAPPNKISKVNFIQSKPENETTQKSAGPSTSTCNENTLQPEPSINSFTPPSIFQLLNCLLNPNLSGANTLQPKKKPCQQKRIVDGSLDGIVLCLNDEHAVNILQQTAHLNKCPIRYEFVKEDGMDSCSIFLNNVNIATVIGEGRKNIKENAANAAVNKLKETHYGITRKMQFASSTVVGSSHLGVTTESSKISDDNKGRKMMKLMGWQGGGLGSKEQGMEEPIKATIHVRRDGLGLKGVKGKKGNKGNKGLLANGKEFKSKLREYISEWIKNGEEQDLVFSPEFSNPERKLMHEVANEFSLKSKSYGKNTDRYIVLSRKIDLLEVVEELKAGGTSEKYELVCPTKPSKV